MNIYGVNNIAQLIQGNSYVGRGIVVGTSQDGSKAVTAYFIMGRSSNSRNRIFTVKDGNLFTEPYDASKVQDPSLIIYCAQKKTDNFLIVTNGNQTDTICDGIIAGKSFEQSLESRCFEPDGPNFTPRISAILKFEENSFCYKMSILKSIDPGGTDCARYCFSYPSKPGLGHFIHTYVCDGNPIPTFVGEPERVEVPDNIDIFTNVLWNALDENNKISLYVRYTDITNGSYQDRLINKNQ